MSPLRLRIRRSQVRVLPSARKKPPQTRGFCFRPYRLLAGLTTYPCEMRFEKVVARDEIPKLYLSKRGILLSRKELDEWLIGR